MSKFFSRREFVVASGALTGSALAVASLSGCAGVGGSGGLSVEEQLALTATQTVDAIRTGRMTATQYTETLLTRADRLSGLNSMISLNRTKALAAARAIDAKRSRGDALPALAGLPIVVKDNINTVDLPTTGGTLALKSVQPTKNAPALQRLIDAGAIVLGKANMHELAFGTTSTNLTPFAGVVRNPYDQTRVPGGSSGGTGAAVAARIAPAGLGSDTGGSVRIPAALCGIAGLRPTVANGGAQKRYDGSGVLPISHTRDTIGPMARTLADVALLDAVMSGNPAPASVALNGLRVGVPASFWAGVDAEVVAVVSAARKKLQGAGVTFVDIDMPGIWPLDDKVSFTVVLHEAGIDIPNYLTATGVQGVTLADIAAKVSSPDVKGPISAVLTDPTAAAYDNAIKVLRPQMQAMYASYFADNKLDAMMFPTTSIQAPVIDPVKGSSTVSINGGPQVDTFANMIRNSDPGSNTGVPGLTLPAGLTAAGMPVGMSLDGPMFGDSRLLGIGIGMEAVLGLMPAPRV
jgi:indoleacetamide hydrolase